MVRAAHLLKVAMPRRSQIGRAGEGAGDAGEGASARPSFDAAALKARITGGFARRREALLPAAQAGDPSARGQLAGLEQAQRAAEESVDTVALAYKQAFTESIEILYRATLLIAALALLVILALPELPLRKSNAPSPAALE